MGPRDPHPAGEFFSIFCAPNRANGRPGDMKFRRTPPGKEDAEYDLLVESWGGAAAQPFERHTVDVKLREEIEGYGPDALEQVFWRASARFVERTDRELAKFRLTMERLGILREVVTAHCPLEMKSLARRFSIAPATLTGLVRRLVDDGYVLLGPDGLDRRVKLVSVTTEGLFAAAAACAVLATSTQELFKTVPSRDRRSLLRALAAIGQLPPESPWQPPQWEPED